MPCFRQKSWTLTSAWGSFNATMICSSVWRFLVMASFFRPMTAPLSFANGAVFWGKVTKSKEINGCTYKSLEQDLLVR